MVYLSIFTGFDWDESYSFICILLLDNFLAFGLDLKFIFSWNFLSRYAAKKKKIILSMLCRQYKSL